MPRPSRNFPGGSATTFSIEASAEECFSTKAAIFWPSRKSSKRRCEPAGCESVLFAFCRTTGTLSSGRSPTATFPHSCNKLRTCMSNDGRNIGTRLGMAICARAATSVFPWKPRAISTKSSVMSSETRIAREFGGSCRGLALVEPEARGTGRPSVSNPLRLAAAPALRLAPNRQPTAVRSRTGCAPTSGSSRLSLRQRRLDRRDREATQNRFDTTSSRKAEEGKINAARSNISPLYIAYYPNSVAGTFSFSGPPAPAGTGFNGTEQVHAKNGSGSPAATWSFANLPATGYYDVYVTWSRKPTRPPPRSTSLATAAGRSRRWVRRRSAR